MGLNELGRKHQVSRASIFKALKGASKTVCRKPLQNPPLQSVDSTEADFINSTCHGNLISAFCALDPSQKKTGQRKTGGTSIWTEENS